VEEFDQRLQPFQPGGVLPPSPFEVVIGDFVVSGNISHATPGGLLFYRLAKLKPKDRLRAWVEHLLHCATRSAGAVETVIVGADSIWKMAPVSDPLPVLRNLLESYWAGLSQPLKFFPECSFAFAEAEHQALTGTQGRKSKTPQDVAVDKWNGNTFTGTPGEGQDPYFSLFFKNDDVLDEAFEACARAVFRPLLEHSEEVKE
jgi:exodeoxyribonuclease V gamma subunit